MNLNKKISLHILKGKIFSEYDKNRKTKAKNQAL